MPGARKKQKTADGAAGKSVGTVVDGVALRVHTLLVEDECPPLDVTSDSLLAAFLHPMSLDEFFADFHKRKAFAVTGPSPERFADIIDNYLYGLDV
jgi:hypothetical protein